MTPNIGNLEKLLSIIDARKQANSADSYTTQLLHKGTEHCAKKFGEEAFELALACMSKDRSKIIAESADLLYHFLVLLAASEVPFDTVMVEIGSRFNQSGLAEKAARIPP